MWDLIFQWFVFSEQVTYEWRLIVILKSMSWLTVTRSCGWFAHQVFHDWYNQSWTNSCACLSILQTAHLLAPQCDFFCSGTVSSFISREINSLLHFASSRYTPDSSVRAMLSRLISSGCWDCRKKPSGWPRLSSSRSAHRFTAHSVYPPWIHSHVSLKQEFFNRLSSPSKSQYSF